MKNTLVLYESKYGFTKMAAWQAALVLGPGKCMRFSEFNNNKQEWDLIVLLIPVYYEKLDEEAVENIKNNLDRLKKRENSTFLYLSGERLCKKISAAGERPPWKQCCISGRYPRESDFETAGFGRSGPDGIIF